jgi:preprotein translocase subunit SecY
MERLFRTLKTLFTDTTLRSRVLFVIGALFVFRMLAAIPVPTIEAFQLEQFFQQNQFFGLVNVFSGGGLDNLSIVMLGVGPYITASIIMQLGTMMSPRLKALYHEQGEIGRRKFIQISRLLTVPLAALQAFGFIKILQQQGVLMSFTTFELTVSIIAVVAGSVLLMWIGELITEFGIGNGTSIIIFAGIVAALPAAVVQLYYNYDVSQIPLYVSFVALALVVIWGTVVITEAERPVPITYAKQVRGTGSAGGVSTYLPLRLNQAGVIPIIFAVSILLLPQMLLNLGAGFDSGFLQSVSAWFTAFYANQYWYAAAYFLLVVAFTFFYTAVTFEPHSVAENLQKGGAFIPGVRPGEGTADFLAKVLTRITLVGALFLGFIAVLPVILQQATGIQALAIGGTALLIVVSVVIDLIKKVDAQMAMRQY